MMQWAEGAATHACATLRRKQDMQWTPLPALAAIVLAGCASPTTPVPPCCYQGAVVTTRLESLGVRTTDGRRLGFDEALPGYRPQQGLFSTALPFNKALGEDIIYASLQPLLPIYDANRDGRLERPEIIVLVAREAARATGTPVEHLLAGDDPAWAVSAPNADVGGLVSWTRTERGRMTPEGQTVFRDLERLGQDLKLRGSEGADRQRGGPRTP